jgi:hypothetical protein
MPFTETGKEKAKREAYMKANKERGVRAEQERDYKMFGTTEQNIPQVNPMGDATMPTSAGMKKGGKVMRKRYADGGLADVAEDAGLGKLERLGLKAGTADYRLGQKTLREEKTAQEMEDLLPSREKIGSAMRSKLDPKTVAEMAMPQMAVARKIAESARDVKMPKSYSASFKKGGSVKSSQLSKSNGIAQRGLTRGKMC